MAANESAFATLRKLSRAVEQSPVSVIITDRDGSIEYVNPKFTQVSGYSSGEVLGMNPRILKSGELPPEVYREMWETITAGREWRGEFHNRKKDGELFWEFASISPIFDERGQITHFVAVKEDVTDRKRAEQALARSELLFRSLIENALDLIVVVAPDGAVHYVSPSVERILGYDPARASDLNVFDLIHPDDLDRAKAKFRRTLETGTRFEQSEFRVRHPDGSWRTLSMMGNLSPPETGTRGLIINARDVTESRALEEQLRRSQKLEAVGQLAGGVAHDFNNLLTVIGGHAELMLGSPGLSGSVRESAEEIRSASERASALTRQLLAFSRKQILQPEVVDLNGIVREMDKMLRRLIGEHIRLRMNLATDLGRVRADPGQIEQVIMNLAVNARDAMQEGGTLTLETANAELDESYAAGHVPIRPGRYVMLAVTDTGVGMDDQTRARLFEPFFTTKEPGKGTGLGLATTYGIVKQSDGYVWVYSELGKGSTFKVYLPTVDAPADKLSRAARPTGLPGGTETILLAEDEDGVRGLARAVLEARGYTVLVASSGPEALALAAEHRGRIDLLLTDAVMPGMSGRALAQSIREARPGTRILVMSGYTRDTAMLNGATAGLTFLEKPFTPLALAQRVREVLDS